MKFRKSYCGLVFLLVLFGCSSVEITKVPSETRYSSWWNGKDDYELGSKLDHVFADESLNFMKINGVESVEVIGWLEKVQKHRRKNGLTIFRIMLWFWGILSLKSC